MIGKTVSHYKIVRKLGAGGMGEVYLAEDLELQRNVALKFLPSGYSNDPDVLARFRREAQAAAALNHPNIITIHEVATYEDQPFIVMAHVEGLSLGEHVKRRTLSLNAILDLAIQIGDGLAKAHAAGIVHRDLKPDNILIDEDGRPKILDFGLAKLAGVTRITQEASTLGTIYYMSPEQTRGGDVDHRSDIFSFGTVLYEMITNRLPFEGDHQTAVMYAITSAEPQPLARYNNEVSPELERIVSKMLAKDPAERYQSAADLVADLKRERRRSDASIPGGAYPTGPVPLRSGRSGLPKIVVPVLVLGVIAALIIINPFRRESRTATAGENSLAVMYFDNMVNHEDHERTGEIIANLLITALSDTKGLRVVSSQRLYDILRSLDKEGTHTIDRDTATEVATRAGARSMLLGNIVSVNPTVVTWQLVDVASGDVIESKRVDGRPGETVFTLVDRMTADLKAGLQVSDEPAAAPVSVADMTTSSAEAYRLYLEGMEFVWRNLKGPFTEKFQQILEIDSTMAMAAFRLAAPNNFFLDQPTRANYIKQAMRHADRVTERDRHMIRAVYAWYHGTAAEAFHELETVVDRAPDDKEAWFLLAGLQWQMTGDLDKAVDAAKRVVAIDPRFKLGYNQLAYIYMTRGEYEKALESVEQYIRVAPDEPNPYDTQAEIYGAMGRLDDAIRSYRKALAIKPDFGWAPMRLSAMLNFNREDDAGLSVIVSLENSDDQKLRAMGRFGRPAMAAIHGQFRTAIKRMDAAITADETEGVTGVFYATKIWQKACWQSAIGENEAALSTGRRAAAADQFYGLNTIGNDASIIELLCRAGKIDEARARFEAIEMDPARTPLEERCHYAFGRGIIAFETGDYDGACAAFDQAAAWGQDFYYKAMRARAYYLAGRMNESAAAFDSVVHAYSPYRLRAITLSSQVHYYAGLAYEATGQRQKARAEYEEFLDLYRNADPEIQIVDDARQRLEKLRRGS